jgi:hypothetical protein
MRGPPERILLPVKSAPVESEGKIQTIWKATEDEYISTLLHSPQKNSGESSMPVDVI